MNEQKSSVSESQKSDNGNTRVIATKDTRNRRRIWAWTLNNYTEEDICMLSHNIWNNCPVNLYVFQEEVGEQGTPHLQGIVQFVNQVSFSTLKEFHNKIRWEYNKKKLPANIKYCSKEKTRTGEIYTYGNVEKFLWKDKPKNTMTDEDIMTDLRNQMENHAIVLPQDIMWLPPINIEWDMAELAESMNKSPIARSQAAHDPPRLI